MAGRGSYIASSLMHNMGTFLGNSGDFGIFGMSQRSMIDTIEVDAIISRETTMDSKVSENPAENGFPVADHVTREPIKLKMECVFTPTPVVLLGLKADTGKMGHVAQALQKIYQAGEPIVVKTRDAIYNSMIMTHAPLIRNVKDGYCYKIQLDFVQARIVYQKTTAISEDNTMSDAQGKAGGTETDGGDAEQTDIGTGFYVTDYKPVVSIGDVLSGNAGLNNMAGVGTTITASISVLGCYGIL